MPDTQPHHAGETTLAIPMPPPPRKPRVIQFPINDICNSRCQMCNIWQQKLDWEISPDQIRTALNQPIFDQVVGIGINGGEPTLRKDIGDVVRATVESLPSLKSISLITNTIRHKQVIEAIKAISHECRTTQVLLDVMVSLDGVGEVHDRVRGKPGNFEAATRVLDFLQSTNFADSIRIGCTIIKENVYDVENVIDWCQRRDLYARFRIGIPHQRLYSLNVVDPFALNHDELYHLAVFLDSLHDSYEPQQARKNFYRSLRDQLVYNKPRQAGCFWQSEGVTLTSHGELAYCAVESKILGSAIEDNPNKLFWENQDHLQQIIHDKCATCLHDYDAPSARSSSPSRTRVFVAKTTPYLMRRIIKSAIFRTKHALRRRISSDHKQLFAQAQHAKAQPTQLAQRPDRILICGWYGTETLGDKAILGGVVQGIRAATANRPMAIDVAAIEPYVTRYTKRQMPELELADIVGLAQAREKLRSKQYRAVVFAGGPLMSTVAVIDQMLELFIIARESGAMAMIAGCGIGPLTDGPRVTVIGWMLKLANAMTFRDHGSLTLAKNKLDIDLPADCVVLDPATLWIDTTQTQVSPPTRDDNKFVLALRDWPIHEYARHMKPEQARAIKQRFENELRRMVQTLTELRPQARIVPLCMHKHPVGGDDRAFYRRLFSDMPQVLDQIDTRHRRPIDDLHHFQTAGRVLAMRFHSLVFALTTRTPTLAIDYTLGGKISLLLNDIGGMDLLRSLDAFDGVGVAHELVNIQTHPATHTLHEKIADSRSTLERMFAPLGL